MTKDAVLTQIRERDVKFIRLWFSDILGRLKSFAITSDQVEAILQRGVGFDGSSITGFHAIEESDMVALPDPTTFQILPYRPQEQAVARMFCDIKLPNGAPYEGDPRYVLRRVMDRAKSLGFDDFHVAVEPEFFYFCDNTAPTPLDRGGYFDLTTLDAASDVRRETVIALEAMGISVASSHHEAGPSQHEIDMHDTSALAMADNVMTYRTVVKEVAHKHGYYATFMPKPLAGENGNGMHTHQTLLRGGVSAFDDPADRTGLSETAKQFIAGQLRHAREMSPVLNQWVNSYKRLVPGFEAPVYVAWSTRNRSAIIRVPSQHQQDESARIEIRCPDPACNPYLSFAVLLAAGLDGIENGYELPAQLEPNLYDLRTDERHRVGIEALPESLGEAIEVGAESELLLRTLGEHIHARLCEIKRREWNEYRTQVTAYEIDRDLPTM